MGTCFSRCKNGNTNQEEYYSLASFKQSESLQPIYPSLEEVNLTNSQYNAFVTGSMDTGI